MDKFLDRIVPVISQGWANSTTGDFTAFALAIVILAWYFTRFGSKS